MSPYISFCTIEPRTGLCLGCARTLTEITDWQFMSSDKQAEINKTLIQRFTEAGIEVPQAFLND